MSIGTMNVTHSSHMEEGKRVKCSKDGRKSTDLIELMVPNFFFNFSKIIEYIDVAL